MTKDSSFGGKKQTKQKMKRFFTMIVATCAFVAVSAQYPMVTLSHNGELSFFDDIYAFGSAYNQAENGDTLYLSEGEFILNGGSFTIKKRLSVVGNGYGSHLLGNLFIDMKDNPNSDMDAPLFDGVRLDKLIFRVNNNDNDSRVSKENLGVSEIRRCWIKELWDIGDAGTNVTIDKCFMELAQFRGSDGNVVVKNSKFCHITEGYSYCFYGTAINCNILSNAYSYPTTMISCIFQRKGQGELRDKMVNHSIINSVLDYTPDWNNGYFHDCNIYDPEPQPLLDENLDCQLNLEELGYLGQDGTVVGIMGGESPFSENPSVPTVDTDKSSVEYDAENDKLKVSITVKAD